MMNVIVIIFTAINLVYLLYYLTKMVKQDNIKKVIKTFSSKRKTKINLRNSNLNKVQLIIIKLILGLFILAFAVTLIAIATAIVWLPILMGILKTWKFGVLVFLMLTSVVSILWSTFIINKKDKIHDSQEAVIRESISILFWFQIGFILYFAKESSLLNMMEFIYKNAYFFNNTATIIFPIVLISSILLNIYLYVIDIRVKVIKSKQWVIQRSDIILMFIISSFIGLLYVTESNLTFVTDIDKFNEVKEVITLMLTGLLIPMVFNKVSNKRKLDASATEIEQTNEDAKF